MQDRPICFECGEVITSSLVFEAPCGHDDCRSACFHGLCLMEFRDRRESSGDRFEIVGLIVRPWVQEHTENEERGA